MRNKRKILITGSAGFIGSYVSEYYAKLDHEVLGLDNLNNYYDVSLKLLRINDLKEHKNFTFYKIDLVDLKELKQVFHTFQPDVVIHLSAQAGVRYSLVNPQSYLDSNIISFFNVLECLKTSDVKKFVFASSSSVYGSSTEVPYEELNDTDNPVSLYAATKKSNEVLAHSFALNHLIPSVGLRFFTVYGPKGRPDMAYFKFANLISSNKEMTIYNKGEMSRDMTFIDDILQGITKAVEFDQFPDEIPFEIFNLGNNSPVSTWDLIQYIENYFNKKGRFVFEDSTIEVKETWANISKSKRLLDFSPSTDFSDGMNAFLDWFKIYKSIK